MLGALTLSALVYQEATPAQMGLLVAATTAPALVVDLAAGVWVDRLPRRSVLIFANFGRFGVLLTIPAAALLDMLVIEQLLAVAFLKRLPRGAIQPCLSCRPAGGRARRASGRGKRRTAHERVGCRWRGAKLNGALRASPDAWHWRWLGRTPDNG
jgi:hypothetical protein